MVTIYQEEIKNYARLTNESLSEKISHAITTANYSLVAGLLSIKLDRNPEHRQTATLLEAIMGNLTSLEAVR